jgi:hypothetical protein
MYNTMVRTNTKKATTASTPNTATDTATATTPVIATASSIDNNVLVTPDQVPATEVVKAKRGRKSKKDLIASLNNVNSETNLVSMELKINEIDTPKNSFDMNKMEIVSGSIDDKMDNNVIISTITIDNDDNNDNDLNDENDLNDSNHISEKAAIKKRGRKPKGGKIIQPVILVDNQKSERPNIILHLKCSMKDLQTSNSSSSCIIESYNFGNKNELSYELLNSGNVNDTKVVAKQTPSEVDYDYDDDDTELSGKDNNKEIWRKLKQLEHNLHINNINNKKSACFWCTCDFDNPPVYIPKHFINNTYNVYGCFCSPECGVAHLMHEPIDSSTKFERYHLLNHIYSKIYEYKKNVKPAPNPYYMLDKFYGNLSIQEYRSLLRNERLFLIVDKPLTRILPELHEDNDEFILNNKIIPSNNYQLKSRMQRKKPNKGSIINEKFGLSNQSAILVD